MENHHLPVPVTILSDFLGAGKTTLRGVTRWGAENGKGVSLSLLFFTHPSLLAQWKLIPQ